MADSFANLPNEILNNALSHCSADDLARLRSVSRDIQDPVRRLQFSKVTFLPTPQSATNVASIIASEHLRVYVQEFCFSALTFLETLDVRLLDLSSFYNLRNTD